MSLDYPFYEELKRRAHPAAKWWRIGDILYYVGLLFAVLWAAVVALLIMMALSGFGSWWSPLIIAPCFVASVTVFIIGTILKGHSYSMAMRDGINVNDY